MNWGGGSIAYPRIIKINSIVRDGGIKIDIEIKKCGHSPRDPIYRYRRQIEEAIPQKGPLQKKYPHIKADISRLF